MLPRVANPPTRQAAADLAGQVEALGLAAAQRVGCGPG